MEFLKLLALDEEDLQIISAALQDAVLRVGDLAYREREKQFDRRGARRRPAARCTAG